MFTFYRLGEMESVEATGGTTFRNRGSVFVQKETGLSFCTPPPGGGERWKILGGKNTPKEKNESVHYPPSKPIP